MNTLIFYTYDDFTARASLPLGPVAPRSSDDLLMQVRNTSGSYQATEVTVAVSGDDAEQLLLSLDGDIFTPTITVGDIPPGAGGAVFTLRRVTPSTAVDGAASAVLTATPSGWSDAVDTSTSDNVDLDADVDIDIEPDDDNTNPPTL